MKILIVRPFPSIINPNQYNVQEIGLAKALTRAGHTCGIVLYYGKNKDTIEKIQVPYNDENREITVYRLRGYNLFKNGFFSSLRRIIKEYDVVQVHEYDQITSWIYYAWSKKPVVIYHGPYYHSFNKGYNLKCRIFDNLFLKIRHNPRTVCLTKSHMAEKFLESRGFKDVTAVGVGVDTDNFVRETDVQERDIEIPKEAFNLLYVGKIEERRNSFFLLEIMEEICRNQKNINCIIIGDGEKEYTKRFLEKAQKLIDMGRLQYYPEASQKQLAHVYENVQLMLFPSHYEIFGMVLVEAAYFGLPVISTPNGGADMLIQNEKNGWILADENVNEWSRLIEKVYLNRDLYSRVCEELEKRENIDIYWDELVEKFVEGYNRAIQGKK